MLEKMTESTDTMLAVRASGSLTHEDYQGLFIPELNACIEKNGKARALLYLDENFSGWELEAAWDDAKFGIQHHDDFIKLAIVGGPDWVEWSVKVGEFFISGEVKTFDIDQLQEALQWVKN